MSDNTMTITNDNFESEVLQSREPVLLDFWASWCGPCKALAPMLDEAAGELAGKVKVGKVDVDEQGSLAEQHQIVSIPTLVLYKDGIIIEKHVGGLSKEALIALCTR
jgi:thioredoxin 1